MKYYINKKKNIVLIDTNDHTPYLADKGYEEISKEEYERIQQNHIRRNRKI